MAVSHKGASNILITLHYSILESRVCAVDEAIADAIRSKGLTLRFHLRIEGTDGVIAYRRRTIVSTGKRWTCILKYTCRGFPCTLVNCVAHSTRSLCNDSGGDSTIVHIEIELSILTLVVGCTIQSNDTFIRLHHHRHIATTSTHTACEGLYLASIIDVYSAVGRMVFYGVHRLEQILVLYAR